MGANIVTSTHAAVVKGNSNESLGTLTAFSVFLNLL